MPDRKLPDDQELDDFFAGRSKLSQRYREESPHEAAPPELISCTERPPSAVTESKATARSG